MLFNSITFLVFLTVVTLLFWITNVRTRTIILFIASITFYGFWRWDFVPLMLFSTLIDYLVSKAIYNTNDLAKKKNYLLVSLCINLGLLVVFKYLIFISLNINSLADLFGSEFQINAINLILPLGISFYTFQTISYTIDVYRGHIIPEKNFFVFGTFVTFFPQLVAGPVLRASEVMEKLTHTKKFRFSFLFLGLQRILYGLFLKVVLADNIAPIVDSGFSSPIHSLAGLDVMCLSFLFGFQIYFDFAGYSHVAIGCAKLMGIDFPENFNFPYMAKSFKEFWKKWHISLSSWIRDYLYLPLLGVKVKNGGSNSAGGIEATSSPKLRNANVALFLTWAIMGLWHGANWTFVFWGVYHSTFVFIERKLSSSRFKKSIGRLYSSWFFVFPIAMLSWIPFRAESLHDTFSMYGRLFDLNNFLNYSLRENDYLIMLLLFIGMIFTFIFTNMNWSRNRLLRTSKIVLQPVKYAVMVYLVLIFLRPVSQFIYFQF